MSIWARIFGKRPKKKKRSKGPAHKKKSKKRSSDNHEFVYTQGRKLWLDEVLKSNKEFDRKVSRAIQKATYSSGKSRKLHIRALAYPATYTESGEGWADILHLKLTQKHGDVVEVRVTESHLEAVFSDGTVYVLDDYGIGYHGTGSYSFAVFLQAAGFRVSKKKVAEMQPPINFKHEGAQLVTSKKKRKKKQSKSESSFFDNGNGTVTDTVTGLQWQKQDDGIKMDYKQAQKYTKGLHLVDYDDWRLPKKEELIELAKAGYKTLKQVFPNIKAERYWAKTTRRELDWAQNPDQIAYTVDFDPESANYGTDVTYFRSYDYYVRAVRQTT